LLHGHTKSKAAKEFVISAAFKQFSIAGYAEFYAYVPTKLKGGALSIVQDPEDIKFILDWNP